jgi:hypothetical protein
MLHVQGLEAILLVPLNAERGTKCDFPRAGIASRGNLE